MAALSTSAELAALQEALQAFGAGQVAHTVTVGDMSLTYTAAQEKWMMDREKELLRRLTIRNVRKRTFPDFT